MRPFFSVLCGVFLLSCLPARAQNIAGPVFVGSASTRAVAAAAASLAGLPKKPKPQPVIEARQNYDAARSKLAGAYESEPSLEERLSIKAVRTPFLSESTYFVTHLWKGLELDGFDNTIHAQNTQLGWLASNGYFQAAPPSNHDQASVGTSTETYGVSLRYTFGREKRSEEPKPLWSKISSLISRS